MVSIDEQSLLVQLARQEPDALDQLVAAFSGPVLQLAGLILGRIGTPEDAEEVAGDVFAAAWQRSHEYDPGRTTLKGWLLMLTKYAALDRRRRISRQRYAKDGQSKVIPLEAAPEPFSPVTPEDEALHRDQQERLHVALERLAEPERELLVRRYFLEEPISDLAHEWHLTRKAMDTRLWRARQNLRRLLDEESEVTSHDHSVL